MRTRAIPVLGDHYGRVLDNRKLALSRDGATFSVHYADTAIRWIRVGWADLEPRPTPRNRTRSRSSRTPAPGSPSQPPPIARASAGGIATRPCCSIISSACWARITLAAAVDAAVRGRERGRGRLHDLLEAQNYRLAWWRSAGRDLGYRRFFDINTLIGLRVEDPQVLKTPRPHRRVGPRGRDRRAARGSSRWPPRPAAVFRSACAGAPEAWIIVEKILRAGRAPAGRGP